MTKLQKIMIFLEKNCDRSRVQDFAKSFLNITRKKFFAKAILVFFIVALIPVPVSANAGWDFIKGLLGKAGDYTIGVAFDFISIIIYAIAGWFVQIAASIFDTAVSFSIASTTLGIPAVETGWEVLRDVANLAFIAVFVYIAFATILQAGGFNTKSLLVNLIIAALLINFSFFLTGVVIDASNVLANILYSAMPPSSPDSPEKDIGQALYNGMKLSSLVDKETLENLNFMQAGIARVLGSMMLFIAAFVFLSGAILFVTRTVVLMFSLVLSPLAFAAAILPATKKHFDRWLNALVGNAFVAPAYLLLLYVVITIVGTQGFVDLGDTQTNTFAAAFNFASEGYSYKNFSKLFLNYILMIGLILGSYTVAKELASGIAGFSVKWAGRATGAAAGLAAFAAQRTLGRGFRALRDSGTVTRMTGSENRAARIAGRIAQHGADYGARARFDVRGGVVGSTMGSALGTALGAVGVRADVGRPGREGGYEAVRGAQVRGITERAHRERGAIQRVVQQEAVTRGLTPEAARDYETATVEHFAEQQLGDMERRGIISTIRARTAANREAAEVLRGRRALQQEAPHQEALTAADIRRVIREERGN